MYKLYIRFGWRFIYNRLIEIWPFPAHRCRDFSLLTFSHGRISIQFVFDSPSSIVHFVLLIRGY